VIVITNGYDKSTKAEVELDTHFTLSHIGSLLSERNPVILWEAISELTREEPSFKEKFRLELIGVVSDEIIKAIKDHGLEENTIIRPYLPHAEAVKAQRCSQVLLLIEINSEQTKGIIPGKLFEYMAARRPVLAIGPEGWEAGELISKTNSGEVLTYKMGKELKATLLKWFKSYKEGKLDLPAQNIEEYSRKELTRKLAQRI
jgi:glycosyltransferase involved in cell wall biosynthesis